MSATAVVDVREFSSEEVRARYYHLLEELRCPKCQNQNLAGSDSPIAKDLRRELHRLLEEGKSNEEIKAFMVARYGDYVLYRPPVQENTLVLWWGPPVILLLGIAIVLLIVWRRRRLNQVATEAELSEADKARLDALLAAEQEPSAVEQEPSAAEQEPSAAEPKPSAAEPKPLATEQKPLAAEAPPTDDAPNPGTDHNDKGNS